MVYIKREVKKTLAPFIEVNPEVLARCIELVVDYVGEKELNDEELEKLIESGNFLKLYTTFLSKSKENKFENSDKEDGIWITYHHESEAEANEKERQDLVPEYLKLYNSLQGYNTGWCTAGSKSTAKDQICGISSYRGGDFHVYYTRDNNGEYKVPRIAIRMNEGRIGEIRGVAESQNLEDGLENIVERKIKEFKNLTEEDINKYLEIINNMKLLTLLNKKTEKQELFTEEEVKFIYELDKKIEGFGWEKDPRIEKIIKKRNILKDGDSLKKRENVIKYWSNFNRFKEAPESIKRDKEIELAAVQQNHHALAYASEELKNDKSFILEVAKQNIYALEYTSEEIRKDKNFILEVVKQNEEAIKYLPEELKSNREFMLAAVKRNRHALEYASEELKSNREFMLAVAKRYFISLEYASEELQNDREIVLAAVKQIGYNLQYASEELQNDREIVLAAAKCSGNILQYASEELQNDREIVLVAVKRNGHALEYASEELQNDREIVLAAVKRNGRALEYASEELQNDKELVLVAQLTNKKNKDSITNLYINMLVVTKNIKEKLKLYRTNYLKFSNENNKKTR